MFFRHTVIDPLVEEIVKQNTREVIDLTVREIATQVEKRTGRKPSTSVIRYSLDRLGIVADSHKARRWRMTDADKKQESK